MELRHWVMVGVAVFLSTTVSMSRADFGDFLLSEESAGEAQSGKPPTSGQFKVCRVGPELAKACVDEVATLTYKNCIIPESVANFNTDLPQCR